MNELAEQIDAAIETIAPERTPEEAAEVIIKLDAYIHRGKEAKAKLESALVDYLVATGHEIVIGTVRYYTGPEKVTKCRDNGEALQSLVEEFGPAHVGQQFLASGAFKPGAIGKEVAEDTFARLFEVTYPVVLKEGKPKLQKTDERFLK